MNHGHMLGAGQGVFGIYWLGLDLLPHIAVLRVLGVPWMGLDTGLGDQRNGYGVFCSTSTVMGGAGKWELWLWHCIYNRPDSSSEQLTLYGR